MRHLHVVDGILLRLRPRQVDIEDERRIALAHEKEPAYGIAAHLFHQLPDGNDGSGSLGELQLLAAAHQRHHLMEHIIRIAGGDVHLERLEADANAGDGAVMIGALHVDGACEAALPFRDVIRDIGNEVRVLVSLLRALPHDAVLVVAEVGRPEPERAVLLVGVARGDESLHRLIDAPGRVQRRLQRIHVELHAEGLQIAILLLAKLLHSEPSHAIEVGPVAVARTLGEVALGDVADVLAVITVGRNLGVAPPQLRDPRLHAAREIHDLRAGVVVVELARDTPSGPLEQRRDGVAKGGLPAMANV